MLDEATINHMKKPRCGRPDFEGPSKTGRKKRYSIPYGEFSFLMSTTVRDGSFDIGGGVRKKKTIFNTIR